MSIAIERRRSWSWCSDRANACTCISTGSIRFWDGCTRASKPGFPLRFKICMNGRTWLARQMDRAGVRYRQQDNCFPWVADWEQAQGLLDTQLQTNWPEKLNGIAHLLNPMHDEIFHGFPLFFYW